VRLTLLLQLHFLNKYHSGKSSLFGAILRLLPTIDGEIYIDSIPTSQVDLWTLRRHIVSIPQDFVHVPGSMRFNMDPFLQCTDQQIQGVLSELKLWDKINDNGGLEAEFDHTQLSAGEKQLLSFARAVLQYRAQRMALILMDEATSSLDNETEALIHELITNEFKDSTVISVAHRQASIRRADVVVYMENGEIVKTGRSSNLQGHIVLE
jgi:ATP-binding cassette, subfamily C (CFTR/MRP), member 1